MMSTEAKHSGHVFLLCIPNRRPASTALREPNSVNQNNTLPRLLASLHRFIFSPSLAHLPTFYLLVVVV